jgi:ferrochelatase
MAYGTAAGVDDIERYYTDIRGGRSPSPEHLAELRSRYAAIGDRFPLLEITARRPRGWRPPWIGTTPVGSAATWG